MLNLNYELADHVLEARDYFQKEYLSYSGLVREKSLQNIKYFKALRWAYEGHSVIAIAIRLRVQEATARQQIQRTQLKVQNYIELKKIGRL